MFRHVFQTWRHSSALSLRNSRTFCVDSKIVVGKVENVYSHPNADKLKICKVNVGKAPSEELIQVVCGAPNVATGQFVPVALPGASLSIPNINSTDVETLTYKPLKIKKSKIRGETSEGMICSLMELGYYESDVSGIWEIQEATPKDIGCIVSDFLRQKQSIAQLRKDYESIYPYFERLESLHGLQALLSWDEQTNMPKEGCFPRGKQKAEVASIVHSVLKIPELEKSLIEALETKAILNTSECRSCEILLEEIQRHKNIPEELTHAQSVLQSECLSKWYSARAKGNFSIVSDSLSQLVKVSKEIALKTNQEGDSSIYDSMLWNYSKGFCEADLNELFDEIADQLPTLSKEIVGNTPFARYNNINELLPIQEFGFVSQKDLCSYLINAINPFLESEKLKLDISAHPFTSTIARGRDVRITTRYSPNNPLEAVMGTIHELGHALYEIGAPETALPAGRSLDIAVHESQAIFWERIIGQSSPFWEFLMPRIEQNLGYRISEESENVLYRSVNLVRPGLIRTESDEIHFPIHILKRSLVNGDIEVANIPEKWNFLYHKYLGLTPASDLEGCLQDMHWYAGAYGYFPSYTLGQLFASHIKNAMEKEIGSIHGHILHGDFKPISEWLHCKIWKKGSLMHDVKQLCTDVCSEKLSTKPFVDYIKQKYLP